MDFELDLQRKKTCGGVYQRSAASAGQVRRSRVPRTYTEDTERTESAEDRACHEITGIQSAKKAHGVFHQCAELVFSFSDFSGQSGILRNPTDRLAFEFTVLSQDRLPARPGNADCKSHPAEPPRHMEFDI